MGEAFLRLSTLRVRSDGGGLFVRTGMEVTVPQLVVILVFSQEGVRARTSIPPS